MTKIAKRVYGVLPILKRDNCYFRTYNQNKLSWYLPTQSWTVGIFNNGTSYIRFAIFVLIFPEFSIFVHSVFNIRTQNESIYLLSYRIYYFRTLIFYNDTFKKSSSVLMSSHDHSSLSGCPHAPNVGDFGSPSLHRILVRFVPIVGISFRFNRTLVGLLIRRNT